jgi:hypothetical protein
MHSKKIKKIKKKHMEWYQLTFVGPALNAGIMYSVV